MSHRHPLDTKVEAAKLYADLRVEPIPDALAAVHQLVSQANNILWGVTPSTPAQEQVFLNAATTAEHIRSLATTAMERRPLDDIELVYGDLPWTPHLNTVPEAVLSLGITERLFMSINDRVKYHDFLPYGGTDSMVHTASLAVSAFSHLDPNFSDAALLFLQHEM